jgi:hypothetical protein
MGMNFVISQGDMRPIEISVSEIGELARCFGLCPRLNKTPSLGYPAVLQPDDPIPVRCIRFRMRHLDDRRAV